MRLENYRPQAKLVTKKSLIEKPRYPVIDAHNHLGNWVDKPLSPLIDQLDQAGVTHLIDLDGGWGEDIMQKHLDAFKSKAPNRFQVFGGVDWSQWEKRGNAFPDWAANRLLIQKQAGAEGVKIWKPFGLEVKDHHGQLVKIDDPRLSPIWQAAGELDLPVLIHIADPVAFFDPINETNERWEELHAVPEWAFTSPPFPPFITLLNGLKNLVQNHPATTFIGAHVGCYAENLSWVSEMLDQCPNFHVDISGRIGELGRQPYSARKFFINHQDRILFATDIPPNLEDYQLHYRFLETDDEYFNYGTSETPGQGRWQIYGLFLPDEVLKKVYSANAKQLFGIPSHKGI